MIYNILEVQNKRKRRTPNHSESNEENDHDTSKRIHTSTITQDNEEIHVIVHAESQDVNLSKAHPIRIAKGIDELVGSVKNIYNTRNGLKIICTKKQANILKNEKKLDMYQCKFTIFEKQDHTENKIKGITFGIDLEITDEELKNELKRPLMQIDKVYRLKKFDKEKNEKVDTTTVILEFSNDSHIEFPTFMYLGYKKVNIKQFIPHPIRCLHCQSFGHIAANCRSKVKCPLCAGNHKFENCKSRDQKLCANCKQNHSAAYKGCDAFVKAKEIKQISHINKISYAEATKVYKDKISLSEKNEMVNNEIPVPEINRPIEKKNSRVASNTIEPDDEQKNNKTTKKEGKAINSERIVEFNKITAESIFTFIFKTCQYFQDPDFNKLIKQNQIYFISDMFEKCTKTKLDQAKLKDMIK